MLRREEIPNNTRFGPISVVVAGVASSSNESIDRVITIEDQDGHAITLNIWSKHGIDIDWQPGHRYELTGVRGKTWTNANGPQYRLSSTRAFSATDHGPVQMGQQKLLVFGDTHIGYRHRASSDKPKWTRDSDVTAGFETAFQMANQLAVNAIVHTGDVFDHDVTRDDLTTVTSHVDESLNDGRPFYYVRGNHDPEQGMDALGWIETRVERRLRLSTEPITLGSPGVNLLGINSLDGDLPTDSLVPSALTQKYPNVLVLHEKPYPVVDSAGNLVYDTGANLERFLDHIDISIDLIITGHMHVAAQGHVRGHDVLVLVTGPTAPINAYERDNRPSVWVVTFDGNSHKIERYELSASHQ